MNILQFTTTITCMVNSEIFSIIYSSLSIYYTYDPCVSGGYSVRESAMHCDKLFLQVAGLVLGESLHQAKGMCMYLLAIAPY